MVGPHPPVPHVEIQPKICPVALVMHGMMRRRIEKSAAPRLQKPRWENLVAAMAKDIERDLPGHEEQKGQRWTGMIRTIKGAIPAWTNASATLKEYAAHGEGLFDK